MRDRLYEDINAILAKWNPIEVPTDIAEGEYSYYVTRVIKAGIDFEKIKAELVVILTSDLGLNYDEKNYIQKSDVENVATEILNKLSKCNVAIGVR